MISLNGLKSLRDIKSFYARLFTKIQLKSFKNNPTVISNYFLAKNNEIYFNFSRQSMSNHFSYQTQNYRKIRNLIQRKISNEQSFDIIRTNQPNTAQQFKSTEEPCSASSYLSKDFGTIHKNESTLQKNSIESFSQSQSYSELNEQNLFFKKEFGQNDSNIINSNNHSIFRRVSYDSTFLQYKLCRLVYTSILSMNLISPTYIQSLCIPLLMKKIQHHDKRKKEESTSALIISSTGSGKTLAYLIPTINSLILDDTDSLAPYQNSPRMLILLPTRELVYQVFGVVKKFQISCLPICAALSNYTNEVKSLRSAVDIIISTPERFLLHVTKTNISIDKIKYLIIDEADTLFDTSYELQTLKILSLFFNYSDDEISIKSSPEIYSNNLRPPGFIRNDSIDDNGQNDNGKISHNSVDVAKSSKHASSSHKNTKPHFSRLNSSPKCETIVNEKNYRMTGRHNPQINGFQLIVTAATATNALTSFIQKYIDPKINLTNVISPDSHLIAPNVHQIFIPLKSHDKIARLIEIIDENTEFKNNSKTIVFCNTIKSCRAVDWTLRERGYRILSIHGEMPYKLRKKNYHEFLRCESNILVTTNVLSRGLDFHDVKHIIMFDFPQSITDYLHRVGRVGRAGDSGRVTIMYSKKNINSIKEIREVSRASKNITFKNKNIERITNLETSWQKVLKMKNRKRKIGGRKKFGLSPRRNCLSPQSKYHARKLHYKLKGIEKLKELRRRGVLNENEKLPRLIDRQIQKFDAQEMKKLERNEDGSLQIKFIRRSIKKIKKESEDFEEDVIPIKTDRAYCENEKKLKKNYF